MLTLPRSRVYINEVVARDGFQNEPSFVPTETKVAMIDLLSRTGLAKIEVTSFVSPKAIPNLRDAEAVMGQITRSPDVRYVALVPNERGAERAVACAVDEVNLVMSVGEQHNLANMRMTCQQSLDQFRRVMALLSGSSIKAQGTIATAFGCPFEGDIPLARVLRVAHEYVAMGMNGVTLADTTGMAHPKQVHDLTRAVLSELPGVAVTLHFHNTRGMGLANVLAALEAGAAHFDAALGGIGGCPFAPGASGNICTVDLVHMLESSGVPTGVNIDLLLDAARGLPGILGHEIPGQVVKAGKSTDLHRPQAAP